MTSICRLVKRVLPLLHSRGSESLPMHGRKRHVRTGGSDVSQASRTVVRMCRKCHVRTGGSEVLVQLGSQVDRQRICLVLRQADHSRHILPLRKTIKWLVAVHAEVSSD